jgi:hypothetical protein
MIDRQTQRALVLFTNADQAGNFLLEVFQLAAGAG